MSSGKDKLSGVLEMGTGKQYVQCALAPGFLLKKTRGIILFA